MFDIFVIKTCRRTGKEITGHLAREISRLTKYLLDIGAAVKATLTSDRYRRSPVYRATIADTENVTLTKNAYSDLVSKFYCKPEEYMSIGSFTEPESNVNLIQKKCKSVKR